MWKSRNKGWGKHWRGVYRWTPGLRKKTAPGVARGRRVPCKHFGFSGAASMERRSQVCWKMEVSFPVIMARPANAMITIQTRTANHE